MVGAGHERVCSDDEAGVRLLFDVLSLPAGKLLRLSAWEQGAECIFVNVCRNSLEGDANLLQEGSSPW